MRLFAVLIMSYRVPGPAWIQHYDVYETVVLKKKIQSEKTFFKKKNEYFGHRSRRIRVHEITN